MATSEKPVMVVGVDESEQSIYALEWALDHFFAPHAPNFHFDLVIVRAKPSPISVVRISGPGSGQALPYGDADLKKIAARVIEQAKELCISKSVDLDLGNYERFLDVTLTRDNITTGKIYQSVLEKERKGDYLGKAVQHDHYMTRKRLVQYVSSVADEEHLVAYRFPKKWAGLTRLEICHRYLEKTCKMEQPTTSLHLLWSWLIPLLDL